MNEHAHESVNVHRWCSVGEWTVDESLYRLIGLISLENRLKSLRLSASGPHIIIVEHAWHATAYLYSGTISSRLYALAATPRAYAASKMKTDR